MIKQGTIIQSTGLWYKVKTDDCLVDCRLPGRFRLKQEEVTNPIAVGDHVTIRQEDDGTGIITDINERENYFPRQATHGRRGEQILIANVDIAWAVLSVRKPVFKPGFIDRFLVVCEAYEIEPGIIFNKTDLANSSDRSKLDKIRALYEQLGYRVLFTSIDDETSLEKLKNALLNKLSVFIGPSGTGKTSLLNLLVPDAQMSVADVSGYSDKGKHTTTFARILPLPGGGGIADTPGIRELGLVNIEPAELSLYFPEMTAFRQECKFYNCTHSHEPGCMVMAAFEEGLVDPERYNSYLNILSSLESEAE